MNKKFKILLSGIISLITIYLGYTIFYMFLYSHTTDLKNYKKYLWMFNDTIQCNIDTFSFSGAINKRDILYSYNYPKNYVFYIWEFKDLSVAKLSKIPIKENVDLDNIHFYAKESTENYNPDMTLTMKLDLKFNQVLGINLDANSLILKNIESKNYRGFYGNISKMTFNNEIGKPLIVFDYKYNAVPSLFLMYKANDSFYVILVNARDSAKIDENTIKLL